MCLLFWETLRIHPCPKLLPWCLRQRTPGRVCHWPEEFYPLQGMNRYSSPQTLEQNGDVEQILRSKKLSFSMVDWGLCDEIQAMCWGQDLWNCDLYWSRSQTITLPSWISFVLLPGTYPLFMSTRTRYQNLELIIDIMQKIIFEDSYK